MTNDDQPGAAVEVEWQFDASDIDRVEAWLREQQAHSHLTLIPRGGRVHTDTYYDSPDWRVFHAGYALRLRTDEGHAEATLKSLERGTEGPARRIEVTERTDGEPPRAGAGPVGSRLRLILGRSDLAPLFTVRTHRRTWAVRAGNQDVALIALDDTLVQPDSEPTPLRRVEVEEAAPGGLEATQPLIDAMQAACALSPASGSKFEAGLLAAGLQPAVADFGTVNVDGDAAFRAYAVLRRQLAELLRFEPGSRLGEDPHAVHQMRVATRRLRAALRTFAPLVPALAQYADEFRWIAQLLGGVRDLDVQREHIEELRRSWSPIDAPALSPILEQLDSERTAARTALIEGFEDDRYETLVRGFGIELRAGPTDAPVVPTTEFAPPVVRKAYRQFRQQSRGLDKRSPKAEYHQLRIRGKRLRYSLELFADVYGGPVRRILVPLRQLQDVLGELQDLDTMDARLRALIVGRGPELPPGTRVAVGRLLKEHRGRTKQLIEVSPRAVRPVARAFERLDADLDPHQPPSRPRESDTRTETPERAPTLRLFLVRHAIAEDRDAERWPDDADRPLTRRGVRRFRRVAKALAAAAEIPQVVLSSPYLRAWRTADLLAEAGWPAQQVHPALIPGARPDELLPALPQSGALALVGHEPDLGRLASFLLTGDAEGLAFEVKKGGVVCLEMDRAAGVVRLKWHAPPSLLRRLS